MKHRIITILITLIGFTASAKAQFFVGGSLGVAYNNETFSALVEPSVGYEFNRKFAVGTGLGISFTEDSSIGIVEPFVRYNACNNGTFFFDIKLKSDIYIHESEIAYKDIGFTPSFRVKLTDHLSVSCDCGLLGFGGSYSEWKPLFSIIPTNATLTLLYTF